MKKVIYLIVILLSSCQQNDAELSNFKVSYHSLARINLDYPDPDSHNASTFNPLEGGSFLVACFHTHPTLSNCSDKKLYWPVGPSKNDYAPKNGMPSFLSDYEGNDGIHRATDPIDFGRKIYNFGGKQRINVY